jgi:RNA polymerase sigma-70 factor (ECF subfamily)
MATQQVQQSSLPDFGGPWLYTKTETNIDHRDRRAQDPDSALVDGLKLRVPEAYDLLFCAYKKRLMRIAFKITMCTEDAEDVVQNTFLQVFRYVERFRGDCQFASWITCIAVNQALMLLRRKKRTMFSLDAGIESEEHHFIHEITGRECTPEQICLRRELEESLIGIVTKVKKANRSVFEMHVAQELPLGEIAQRLGITLAATKSRLFRARRDIRSRAKKHSRPTQFKTNSSRWVFGERGQHFRHQSSDWLDTEMPVDRHSLAS